MPYNTPTEVREICGLTVEAAPDQVLSKYITRSDQALIAALTVRVYNEEMFGDLLRSYGAACDGSTKTFYTYRYPLADTNATSTNSQWVWTDDLTVYLWTTKYDESTRTTAAISSINASTGKIVLSTAPSNLVVWMTADYSYYYNNMNWTILKETAALGAGYRFVRAEYFYVPDSLKLGPLSISWRTTAYGTLKGITGGGLPHQRLYHAYLEGLNLLRSKIITKTEWVDTERMQELEAYENDEADEE